MKVFIEQQKFTQPLVIIALSIAFVVTAFSIYKEWSTINTGSLTEKLSALSGLIIVLLVVLLFVNLKLKTRIDEKGVYYQFFPFQFSFKFAAWNTISTCYIRKYNGLTEFGGWGMKRKIYGKGRCYTTKGTIGLQIEFKNGKQLLIGSQHKEELQRTLDTYKSKIIKN
ncbi:hypothetical protein SAMN06265371_103136 [Lutibacter agarilyticus]|uniref:Uncharacterized protein n=1 Tax=Lutibacter agarilyticus TaxID=1109740 RepID=A0A238WE99_9FLAO|nr:hypothetical protein [Lutibacter agarilyticus]SNR44912.1 hypothetical protein SAMN06265371_103136 [Lutibacter agarilyticus]